MKNGATWKVIAIAATVLFGMVSFILGGWRTDMANAATERDKIGDTVVEQGKQITTLEAQYKGIEASLDRIEKKPDGG